MEKIGISIGIYLIASFISSVSQILLRKEAMKEHKSYIFEYVNFSVIAAYFLLFITTLLAIFAFKNLSISMGSVLESSGYIFVAILSKIFLKERMSTKSKIGYGLIIIGIIMFSIYY